MQAAAITSAVIFALVSCQLPGNEEVFPQAAVGVDGNRLHDVYVTDAGLLCLWDPEAFSEVHDFDSWMDELLNESDIQRHLDAGHFVPIRTYSDGVYEIDVRVGSFDSREDLSERERTYLIDTSTAYRFVSQGTLAVSGIEYVNAVPDEEVGVLNLVPGEYSIIVNRIAWEEEPGMVDDEGYALEEALPDFVILVNPISADA
jgi:hypothetical protein